MKFLLLCHNYPEYGTFFRAFQLGRHLVKAGHTAVVMLVSRDKRFWMRRYDRNGVWVIECPNYQSLINDREDGWGPLDIALRCLYGLTHRFDIVVGFGHKPDIAVPALLLKYLKGATFVTDWCDLWGEEGIFTVRGLLEPRRWGSSLDRALVKLEIFLEKLVVRQAHAVTVICTPLLEICKEMGIERNRLLLLRSGCDVEGIEPLTKRAARKEIRMPGGKILEYLGNYHQEARLLFSAFERICSSREDVFLLIVGPKYGEVESEDMRYPTEGKRKYWSLPEEVRSRIIWAGKRRYAELSAYLSAADLLLLPMEATGLETGRWPNKVCDYLASGRPIAATDVGDAGRFIREHGCGIVSEPHLDDYSRIIIAALDNKNLLRRAGSRARTVAENELSWQKITETFLAFVSTVAGQRKGKSKMRKAILNCTLAFYTIGVILFEGIYLLCAWAALKLGWQPRGK